MLGPAAAAADIVVVGSASYALIVELVVGLLAVATILGRLYGGQD